MTSTAPRLHAAPRAAEMASVLLRPGGITTSFQPLVRIADGTVIGYEALSRAAAAPTTSPALWLLDAEASGLRAEVELACLEAAAAAAADLPSAALLFVNVSPDVVVDPRFPAVAAQLPRHVLEVTEDAAVLDYEPLRSVLQRLRGAGSLVAVDDVGSGYASMAHVLQLSPSFIKIDRSLVSGLDRKPGQRALVTALQAFAAAIGALTVAEGVETAEELAHLKAIGVDLAQGFLLARPGPAWPRVEADALAVLLPRRPAPEALDVASLEERLRLATTQAEACDVVEQFLSRRGGLLPSIYLERGGVLRCQSRRGQWLVMDGLLPGSGITGAAFASDEEVLVQDVRADPRYRLAVPGVSSEMAVPLRVAGRPVGVLNVDAVATLCPETCDLVRRCAGLLATALDGLENRAGSSSTLHHLSRLAPTLAHAGSAADLGDAVLAAVTELSGFDSACLWTFEGSDHRQEGAVASVRGPGGAALAQLGPAAVGALRDLVAELSSCYSGGTDLSLAVEPTSVLREDGARGAIIVPVRDGWRLTDLMVVTSSTTSFVPADVVDAVENLGQQAGSRLAALRRVAELERLVHLDPLTGLGNRGLWQLVLDDEPAVAALASPVAVGNGGGAVPEAEHAALGGPPARRREDEARAGEPVWLALADVDRFKVVNDTRGHLTGDRVLRTLADVFATLPGWSAFRLGGDEFALIGPVRGDRPDDLASAVSRAQAVLAPVGASLSVGAVRTRRSGLTAAVDPADRALYERKRSGGAGLTVVVGPAPD